MDGGPRPKHRVATRAREVYDHVSACMVGARQRKELGDRHVELGVELTVGGETPACQAMAGANNPKSCFECGGGMRKKKRTRGERAARIYTTRGRCPARPE